MSFEPSRSPVVSNREVLGLKVLEKPVLVKLRPSQSMGDLVQVGRALGKRIFKTDETIRVVDLLRINRYEWVCLVQYAKAVQGSGLVQRGEMRNE